ncbi:hypothetical protein L226DRAFT_509635 [Lentinus tigrinus ALCF2SS1-7]|uniref:Fungal-type protein kinase domain-containing protein n=1 Tax=Lentinus tigrinus ALCF2SS1-6 TaxID=1328759 RepID=A0A5C2RVD2_9APHY|nr:hypothetical protein L227DRAFT_555985 [Lentinus tigrinus ALCF2SS1-6]RPD73876.1 hypothetical protein L226DRAFT_509635 [Lentinus tigrinus ALCF2SS1-7]
MNSNAIARPFSYDVPVELDCSLSPTNCLDPSSVRSRNLNNAASLRSRTVGPMPVQDFIDFFLPQRYTGDLSRFLSSRHAFNSVPSHADSVPTACRALVAALNRHTKHKSRCPGFVFELAATPDGETVNHEDTKPHIFCYASDNLDQVRRASARSRAEFGYVELFIDVEPDASHDCFADPPTSLDDAARATYDVWARPQAPSGEAPPPKEAFGQHVAYVAEVFARQHRTCFFSLAVFGSSVRIFRWERSGCVVTESFNIRKHPNLLCDFLWRFSQVPHVIRGHDMSVEAARPGEEDLFRDAITAHVQSQLELEGDDLDRSVKVHYEPGRVFAIHILPQHFSSHPENIRRFVVSRPVVSPLSLIGRGTRGYWALDASTHRVVFLKDTWRFQKSEELEGDTIRRLVDLGVRHVPSLVWHGDIPYRFPPGPRQIEQVQQTVVHTLLSDRWLYRGSVVQMDIHQRRHYRLITNVAGYSLGTLRGAEELLYATYDTFTAMRDALAKDSRIHRDISIGNFILVKEPDRAVRRGYLIDWEASCRIDEEGNARLVGRVGTWAFTSLRMLSVRQLSTCKQTFTDDMESLLYVVLYCALLWQPHNLSQQDLTKFIAAFFHESQWVGGVYMGGGGKSANAFSRTYTGLLRLGSKALQEWLTTVLNFHRPPHDAEEYMGKWNAEHLDTYWATFLQTHTLERDNRLVHTVDTPNYHPSPTPSTTYSPRSVSSSVERIPTPPSAQSKSPSLEAPSEPSRAKRMRTPSPVRSTVTQPRTIIRKTRADMDTSTLRRSKRLQEKQIGGAQASAGGNASRQPTRRNKGSKRKTRRPGAASRK